MTCYDYFKDYTELIYFLSGPVLAFFAWRMMAQLEIGSQQVKIAVAQTKATEKITKIQIKREARLVAAKQIEIFSNIITPEIIGFDILREDGKYPLLSKAQVIEDFPRIQCNTDDLLGLCNEIVYSNNRLAIKILNRIESLSTYFTSGVADAEVAYRPIGNPFCEFVRTFLPYIVVINSVEREFGNTLSMYVAWSSRDKIEKTKNEICKHEKVLKEVIVPEFQTFGLSEID